MKKNVIWFLLGSVVGFIGGLLLFYKDCDNCIMTLDDEYEDDDDFLDEDDIFGDEDDIFVDESVEKSESE